MDIRKYLEMGVSLPLGISGENGIESYEFGYGDWASSYGEGVLSINHQRPGDSTPYPVGLTVSGHIAHWDVTAADVQYSGHGRIQVVYAVNGIMKKSIMGTTVIEPSLGENVGADPAMQSYIDTMVEIKDEAYQSMVTAVNAKDVAVQKAQDVLGLTAEASISGAVGTPSVSVELTQEGDHKNLNFSFSNLKGETGYPTEAQIVNAVEEWLDEHISEGIAVDDTLSVSGAAADAKVTGDTFGAFPVPDEETVSYTYSSNQQVKPSTSYTTIATAIDTAEANSAWKIGVANITAGNKVKVTQYTYGTSSRSWILFADDSGNITGRENTAAGSSALVTGTYIAPEGTTKIYVQTYSSDANMGTRLVIKKVIEQSVRVYVDNLNTALKTEVDDLRTKTVYSLYKNEIIGDRSVVDKSMNVGSGSYTDSANNNRATGVISIYSPVLVSCDYSDVQIAVNQYARILSPSTAQFVKCIGGYGYDPILVTANAYPVYIVVGFTPDDSSHSNAQLQAALHIRAVQEPAPAAALSMFPSMGITGCSWDSGSIYAEGGSHVSPTILSWGHNIARRNGTVCHNYAVGGENIKSWFNHSNTGIQDQTQWRGMEGVLANDADPVYFFPWGNVNDAAAIDNNVFSLGSIDDIEGSYESYPSTFYGLCGRALEMMMEHAPDSYIIVMKGAGLISIDANRIAVDAAMKEIAEHYSLPYLDFSLDSFYPEYCQWTVSNHPTAAGYSGAAMMIERCFSSVIRSNHTLFAKYNGNIRTVPVQYSPVS